MRTSDQVDHSQALCHGLTPQDALLLEIHPQDITHPLHGLPSQTPQGGGNCLLKEGGEGYNFVPA